jgi:hypothetical protein
MPLHPNAKAALAAPGALMKYSRQHWRIRARNPARKVPRELKKDDAPPTVASKAQFRAEHSLEDLQPFLSPQSSWRTQATPQSIIF